MTQSPAPAIGSLFCHSAPCRSGLIKKPSRADQGGRVKIAGFEAAFWNLGMVGQGSADPLIQLSCQFCFSLITYLCI